MLYSMTGYGEAYLESCGMAFSVQVRAVNNKFLKTSLKLPETLCFLEERIDKLLRGHFTRGYITLTLSVKSLEEKPLIDFNQSALNYYIKQLSSYSDKSSMLRINAANLLHLPGVIEPYEIDDEQKAKINEAAAELVAKACDKLTAMRGEEGAELKKDLLKNCDEIESFLNDIAGKVSIVVKEYTERLRKRINELMKDAKISVDENTLIRETAVFADRSDISEEVSRLKSHIKQFRDICQKGGGVGKRLDFLAQEMFREANTIGSKASDAGICQLVVDVKSRIDRIKEQVQNVE
ncbi:YicC/YloC family endoribonuclease [Sedimentisphaera salicampi]|uniref:YicC-like family, N-terminal region n=1 Tax=Sedimentisphaera salicampi TaxID=1941349 RepID=A0A1W6LNR4_9BACT|nr:YicC/YloC family endoribonuclease [Sedimentisphaera salicampi]ARN57440.1 hypothetical protein STSP1_01847 [Sedimentisphaera salicampi]OXU14456.1 hypothetical protein SMSP1_01763 [Sedimentisphaera salicampi]